MYRKLALASLCAAALFAGCRNDTTNNKDLGGSTDLAGGGGNDDLSTPGGPDMAGGVKCQSGYTDTTIAAMRTAGKAGCFRVGMMANVVNLIAQGSNSSSRAFIQDEAGGDFSAMQVDCTMSASATKNGVACSINNTVKALGAGHRVVVSGFYIKFMNGDENFNVLDTASDSGTAGTAPTALAPSLADVAWKSTTITAKDWFKYANVTMGGATLKAYEWGPLVETNSSPGTPPNCGVPYVFGFGLIPSTSSAASMPGAACTGNSSSSPTRPQPVATPSTDEILISTLLYQNFKYTSDCYCGFSTSTYLMAGDSFTMLKGYIVPNSSGTSRWLTIAPGSNADVGK